MGLIIGCILLIGFIVRMCIHEICETWITVEEIRHKGEEDV